MEMIFEIMNLKQQKRSGWIISGRDMCPEEVESVSDHSWAACMIALLYLPEWITENNIYSTEMYDKERIIRMLIVHDLAESFLGDIAYGMKTLEDKERERERFDYYASLNMDKYKNSLTEINELWVEFEALQTFNSKVAKDIDQIEGFIQLNIYKDKLISKNGIDNWKMLVKEWKGNLLIRTHLGKAILSNVEDIFDNTIEV